MSNMGLWHKVEKTPTEHTKAITGKSYSGTSPKPHWLVMKATETFGPCGIGWGFTIDERVEDGAMIAPGFYHRMHIAKVTVWYIWNDKRGQVEHIGGTEFSGQRASGKPFTDEDAAKKSVTDALVKALSMIGFAGDIFMGRYDDSKYVQGLKVEEREAANPPPKPEVIIADELPFLPEADESQALAIEMLLAALVTHKTYNSLATWWKSNQANIKASLPSDYYEAEVVERQIKPRLAKYKAAA
jgi:hypothetical protein